MDFNVVLIGIQVIFLEGVLSIDNAAVLGAMVSVLPKQTMVPWPEPLKFLALPVHRLLGGQQGAALKVGLLGAYIGRGLMLVLASFVIQNDFLKFVGAAYLIKLAFENLGAPEEGEEAEVEGKSLEGKGFWSVVLAVELADLAFSLDNVVAVIALSDNLLIVMFGVAMGILTMRFAAGIFTWMISREPILKAAAYMVVFNIGFELMLSEFAGLEVPSGFKFIISVLTLILFVIYAHVKPLQSLRPIFRWVAQGMADVNELVDWALVPIGVAIKIAFKLVWLVVRPFAALLPRKAAAPELAASSPGDCGEAEGAGATDEP
ncbi:MAG: tellurium resistance protein TerC [Chloroflexota bacterium]|nr:tellurium resistance protein TerC [Chloroflexota bacterium]